MNGVTLVSLAVVIWLALYIIVYIYYFNSESPPASSNPLVYNNLNKFEYPANAHKLESRKKIEGASGDNLAPYGPSIFLSEYCQDVISFQREFSVTVSVIIAVRNEEMHTLITTVESVMENSGRLLESIIIVDDYSDNSVR